MKKSILALIALLILLVIGVLVWNANKQANMNGTDDNGAVVDDGDDVNADDDDTATDSDDDTTYAETTEDTTDGTGIDDVPMESESANIKVQLPDDGQKVGVTGLTIVGEGRVFENSVNWRVKNAAGTVIASGVATAAAPDVGQFGTFVVHAAYSAMPGTAGTVEAYTLSARDGAEIDVVTVPVRFVAEREVPVYFGYAVTAGDCTDVHSAPRMIPTGVSRRYAMESAVWELLMGITEDESDDNYATHIPTGVTLDKLTLTGGTVRVDFSSNIETGGSCSVGAIRAQIEQTLEHFPGVTSVVITVAGGDPDEALQP